MFQLFAVQVMVVTAGFTGFDGFMLLQEIMRIPHAYGQKEEQEQEQAPQQAICLMPQHF